MIRKITSLCCRCPFSNGHTSSDEIIIGNHALELFPFLADLPFTRDLKPLIGKLPNHKNLYLLTGLSSSGFEKRAMAGKLLAEGVHGRVGSGVLGEMGLWEK